MKTKLMYALSALMMLAMMLTTSCSKEEDELAPTPATIAVDGVKLSETTLTFVEGDTESKTLVATITPEDADDKDVTWESDNSSKISVIDGVVKLESEAIAGDEATITATTHDGGLTATCKVSVTAPAKGFPEGAKLYMYDRVLGYEEVTEGMIFTFDDTQIFDAIFSISDVHSGNTRPRFEDVTWSSSETGERKYVKTSIFSGSGLILIKQSVPTESIDITISATAPNGETKSFVIRFVGAKRIGDYYYTDGTWCGVLYKNKVVEGVIFNLSNGGEDGKIVEIYKKDDIDTWDNWDYYYKYTDGWYMPSDVDMRALYAATKGLNLVESGADPDKGEINDWGTVKEGMPNRDSYPNTDFSSKIIEAGGIDILGRWYWTSTHYSDYYAYISCTINGISKLGTKDYPYERICIKDI